MGLQGSYGAETRLHIACAQGNVNAVEVLLKADRGAIHQKNQNGMTPLHVAMACAEWPASEDIVTLLTFYGADVNSRTPNTKETPLHLLIGYGKLSTAENTVAALIRQGANPKLTNHHYRTPGDIAQANGYVEIARFLDEVTHDSKALNRWERTHQPRDVARIEEVEETEGEEEEEELPRERRRKNSVVVPKEPPVDEQLVNAVITGNVPLVDQLVKKGAKVNYQSMLGYFPVHYAVAKRQRNMIELLQALLANGADINTVTAENDNVVSLAIKKMPTEDDAFTAVEFLLKSNASSKIHDQDGKDPLMLAEERQWLRVAELIARAQGRVFVEPTPKARNPPPPPPPPPPPASNRARTPPPPTRKDPNEFSGPFHEIHLAVKDTQTSFADAKEIIDECLKSGTKIDLRTKEQSETCLHIACARAHIRLVEYLLGNDATVDVSNNNEETPLSITRTKTKHKEIEKLLVEAQKQQLARRRWRAAGIATQVAGKTKNCNIL